MNVTGLNAWLVDNGISLELAGDDKIRPSGPIAPTILTKLKEHKPEILERLKRGQWEQPGVTRPPPRKTDKRCNHTFAVDDGTWTDGSEGIHRCQFCDMPYWAYQFPEPPHEQTQGPEGPDQETA